MASVQQPIHGCHRASVDWASAGIARSAKTAASRVGFISPTENEVHTAGEAEAGQINRLEIDPIASELGCCPQISAIDGDVDALEDADIHTAEHLCAWRPAVRHEGAGKDREIDEIDEVAHLFEFVMQHTGSGTHIRHHRTRHPDETAQFPTAIEQRVADVTAQVHLAQRGRLLDRQPVVVEPIAILRQPAGPAEIERDLHVETRGELTRGMTVAGGPDRACASTTRSGT